MIALAIFILWIVFNSNITLELIIFGAVIAIALSFFVQRFITPRFTWRMQLILLNNCPATRGISGC